jgi:hypothetical protein
MEQSNGFGGGGRLDWLDQARSTKLGWAQTDVLSDGRPKSMLFYENGSDLKMGDCRTSSELNA